MTNLAPSGQMDAIRRFIDDKISPGVNSHGGEVLIHSLESNVLTLRGAKDGNIYWNVGTEPAEAIPYSGLNALLIERNRANPQLITLIKVDRSGTYTNVVDMLDEIKLANVSRFSISPFTPADSLLVLQTQTGPAPVTAN